MIRTDALKGLIAEKGMSQVKVATAMGITPKTFYEKMKRGVFGTDEVEVMIELLEIEDPMKIFFAQEVTCKDTSHI